METVYLGLGSNLGDRHKNIKSAIRELKKAGVRIEKIATVIETEPVGAPSQCKFLNTVIKAQTNFSPEDLLQKLKTIETKLGRTKTVTNGPRTIDIDILLYAQLQINKPGLTIPHPSMFSRDFVITPLNEIEPDILRNFQNENC